MEALNQRNPGQSWNDVVLEQEKFNTDPMNQGGSLQDQYAHRYNYEDNAPFGRKDSDSEEAEEEEEDNN